MKRKSWGSERKTLLGRTGFRLEPGQKSQISTGRKHSKELFKLQVQSVVDCPINLL